MSKWQREKLKMLLREMAKMQRSLSNYEKQINPQVGVRLQKLKKKIASMVELRDRLVLEGGRA